MEWEISERSKSCIICGKKFAVGSNYNSALFLEKEKVKELFPASKDITKKENKNDLLLKNSGQRLEFCPDCWEEKVKDQSHDISWQGEFLKKKNQIETRKMDRKEMLDLFVDYAKDSISATEDGVRFEKNNIAYFLAIFLERKNILIFKEEFINDMGIKCVLYEVPKSEDRYILKVPFLNNDLLKDIQQKVYDLLDIDIKVSRRKKVKNPVDVEPKVEKNHEA